MWLKVVDGKIEESRYPEVLDAGTVEAASKLAKVLVDKKPTDTPLYFYKIGGLDGVVLSTSITVDGTESVIETLAYHNLKLLGAEYAGTQVVDVDITIGVLREGKVFVQKIPHRMEITFPDGVVH